MSKKISGAGLDGGRAGKGAAEWSVEWVQKAEQTRAFQEDRWPVPGPWVGSCLSLVGGQAAGRPVWVVQWEKVGGRRCTWEGDEQGQITQGLVGDCILF